MELQYKEEHAGCRYYATGHNALFRQWHLAAGDALPADLNRKSVVLLYQQEGVVETTVGGTHRHAVQAGHLFLLPHSRPFTGRALGDAILWSCAVPPHIPLCERYELIDLQRDMLMGGVRRPLRLTALP